MKGEKKAQRMAEDALRERADEAIAFMRSMVCLAEKRGVREVDPYFASAVIGLADLMLSPHLNQNESDLRQVSQ